jgi:glycosyltransferase involved in cell wall biosynthesis
MRESYAGLPAGGLVMRAGLYGLNVLVTNSRTNAASLQRDASFTGRVQVVSNGVAVPDCIAPAQRIALKAELGFSAADRVIGTIGRVDANKNQSMLLRALALMIRRWPALRVAVIGGGPLIPQLRAESELLGIAGSVRFTGSIPGAARLLPAFDVCCLTSHTEGMANLLMEASAAGVPVVTTDSGGSRDVVTDGVTGFVIPRDDVAQLAARVDTLLADGALAEAMGRAGRARMLGEFSIPAMAARMAAVYDDELQRTGVYGRPAIAHRTH